MRTRKRGGFTLVELLVVVAIIGILISMMLPAIQAAREAARRLTCRNNLTNLGLALQNYQNAHEVLPPGVTDPKGPIRNVPRGLHVGWLVQVLPYIEEEVTFGHVDLAAGVYHPNNAPVRSISIALFICPSYAGMSQLEDGAAWISNYAGCHHDVEAPIDEDNHGVLFLNSRISDKDVLDGTTHTIYVGEKLAEGTDLGWMSGTRATLRNTGAPLGMGSAGFGIDDAVDPLGEEEAAGPGQGPDQDPTLLVGGFGSDHSGVTNFLFGDGAIHSISNAIAPSVWQQLGHRCDGKLLKEGPTRYEW